MLIPFSKKTPKVLPFLISVYLFVFSSNLVWAVTPLSFQVCILRLGLVTFYSLTFYYDTGEEIINPVVLVNGQRVGEVMITTNVTNDRFIFDFFDADGRVIDVIKIPRDSIQGFDPDECPPSRYPQPQPPGIIIP